MVLKKISVVPTSKDLIDTTLPRIQRHTPTTVHKGFAINCLRQFYLRKVKYTQNKFHDKLSTLIDDFPRLDDVHPFYADLLRILYNKDHYNVALGEISRARNLISRICNDYVKLLKYAVSSHRCKSLKVAALARMCSAINRISPSLAYLEQIRQHMSRIPSIDPNARTILIFGCPNGGKSSFMTKITGSDVDVQPGTTKSLFVGHMDNRNMRHQVIDIPGLLDQPFKDHIEITALRHLEAAIVFILDLSGSCGYSIPQQATLFHHIKSLLMNKPLIVVYNKSDLSTFNKLTGEDMRLVMEIISEAEKNMIGLGCESMFVFSMSTLVGDGVIAVKNAACALLNQGWNWSRRKLGIV